MKSFWRWFILVAGIAMLLFGVWFMFNPLASLIAFTSFIGVLLLINGIFLIVNYINDWHEERATRWVLAEGVVTLLLGTILLLNEEISILSLTITFGLWVLFSGVIRIMAAFTAKDFAVSGWGWILALGTITTLLGFISLFNPTIGMISIAVTIGLFFIMQGINAISTFYYIGKLH